ncbi:MAG: L-threonylcarbamoyladenylate synthase [Rhodobacteraceae bacterium]|nr:L-threonylcarbamoyladenylate synthase [Paracoccaceae bacterium]
MLETLELASSRAGIESAADILRQGGIVGFPTETVYGLAADATNPLAVRKIFAVKGRPVSNPLILHLGDPAQARRFAVLDETAKLLCDRFWPGSLTVVLPAKPSHPVCSEATAGATTLAVRVPSNAVARRLLSAFGGPVVAPSANLSGCVSPTTAAHVRRDLGGRIDALIDGGRCSHGMESTIVEVGNGAIRVLRDGAVARAEIAAAVGLATQTGFRPGAAPGQLASHYAPTARLRLNAIEARDNEVWLGFGPDAGSAHFNLSKAGDTTGAARNFYGMLRAIDALATKTSCPTIAVSPIPERGLGRAINDRLRRAAHDNSVR